MIRRLRIQGYKSLRSVEVPLEPLTVLIGLNAAGKSDFLDAGELPRDLNEFWEALRSALRACEAFG